MKHLRSAMPEKSFSAIFKNVRKDVIANSMPELQENREKDVGRLVYLFGMKWSIEG